MTIPDRRSRSTTAASQRPPSRASTTSMHTPLLPQEQHVAQFSQDPFPNQHVTSAHQILEHYDENDAAIMALQGQHGLFDQQQLHGMDLGTNPHMHTQMHNGQNGYYQPQPTHFGSHPQGVDYSHMQAPPPVRPISASGTSNGKGKKKANGVSSAANEKHEQELHDMLNRNQGRSLSDVGAEVLKNERTSKCEKSKQLFAMLWLNEACVPAKTSVPRGRVYTTYANRCGDERVQPLNPASFGKLVRVIFPGITTRRLGVRGESKYHYVDLALKDDPEEETLRRSMMDTGDAPVRPPSIKSASIDLGHPMPRLAPDTAVLPRDDEVFQSPTLESGPLPQHADGRIFADTVTPGFLPRGLFTANAYTQPLSFAEPDVPKDILLPEISQYVPPNHDTDAANALAALYRSHCISLVDCIRYCKQKQFFRLFTSFSGTLTVPVQKLFVNPALAGWIKESDWIMYQNMLQSMYNLTLDVLPMPVTRMLDTISKQLRNHITRTFQGHPHHVLEAKLEPATLFSELVARLLKVNSTAHAAAVVLQQQECRETMWRGWVETVNPKKLMESELPGCGQEETYNILTRELLPLLRPVVFMDQYTLGTHYRESLGAKLAEDASESYIDRIGQFVQSIPARFPNAKPRTIIDCVKNLGTAAMRDLTIEQSTSFNGWWLVKIFIDEMIQWLATSRGFMAHRPTPRDNQVHSSANMFSNGVHEGSVGGGSEHQSRYSSMGADYIPDALSSYQTSASQSTIPQHSQIMMPSQSIPTTFGNQAPRPQMSRKRSATDGALEQELMSPGKRARRDQIPTSQPNFEHHASFGSSFESGAATRPASSHEVHDLHDDSGIGLGLFDQPFIPGKIDGTEHELAVSLAS